MISGLVMEGGAMRGLFTCGVIDVFMENGITFDKAVGVSAGAAFGCNFKSRQIGRPLRYNKTYCGDKRYASISSWLHTGNFFNAEFCYKEIPNNLDPWDTVAFEENPMEFYCVATDIETGKPVYHKCKDGRARDIEWIRASSSIPLAAKPVEIKGHLYLDGGISDSIPLRFMESLGCNKIVVIETQPKEYIKKKNRTLPLVRTSLHKYPKMVQTIANRHIHYNAQKWYVRKRVAEGAVYVIRPKAPLNISARVKDPAELERVYQLGRECALENLKAMKQYLQRC